MLTIYYKHRDNTREHHMTKTLKKLAKILDGRQKRHMACLVAMMFVGAILETMSIALLIPAVTLVMDPAVVQTNRFIAPIYAALGFTGSTSFTIFAMTSLIVFFILKALFIFVQTKLTLKFVYTNQFATSRRLMINFMKRPYEFYLGAETAVIQRSITADVNNMYGLILALLQLLSESIVFLSLAIVCMISEPLISVIFAALLVVVLLVIKGFIQPVMRRTGTENQDYYGGLFKWINQAVAGIKEIKIAGKEHFFINEYAKCGRGFVATIQRHNLYNSTPRLLIETVAISAMVIYIMLQAINGTELNEFLPTLTAIGYAAMRMIPCANRINNHLTQAAYFEPFFEGVSENLKEEISDDNIVYDPAAYENEYRRKQAIPKMEIKESITLSNISYKYPGTDVLIFDHADLEIPIGQAVGIVGASGSGKTTVVDIMLGLLHLDSGSVRADGRDVREEYDAWLKNIGFVPQTIFMMDGNIRENVAFGLAGADIDDEKVWRALREAQLDEFVKGLPDGLSSSIGERGIRISGGQRQRLGIARALYEDPDILVFDEATSALDTETEGQVMEQINRLHGKKTLIVIAHRLQTIEKCDIIYKIEGGKACPL